MAMFPESHVGDIRRVVGALIEEGSLRKKSGNVALTEKQITELFDGKPRGEWEGRFQDILKMLTCAYLVGFDKKEYLQSGPYIFEWYFMEREDVGDRVYVVGVNRVFEEKLKELLTEGA